MNNTEKALNYYRSAVEGKRPDFVPARVVLPHRVRADAPFGRLGTGYYAEAGPYDCESNKWGAVSVLAENGQKLGVKPSEFDVVEWKANDK